MFGFSPTCVDAFGEYPQAYGLGDYPTSSEIAAAVRTELAVEMGRLLDLAKINGLVSGVPSVVTETSRIAGDVAQTISENAGTVTVSRA